ncbi:VPS10 domain-containing receptor SorCS3 [Thelohanellus kitauei]|uniref:VPS10 domain-containing receptor SorCS3 n=1 Tax=Thelohanellus kitauei TaxID=669202 RepID=A0A0C2MGV4_THEKT|nr:VPS10 domain-containing receptor SorCS3 [Thelohanellus kitauei]
MAIEFEGENSYCGDIKCRVELDLRCSNDLTKNYFPTKWNLKFQGSHQGKFIDSVRTFISFDAGESWKMYDSQMEKLVFLNRGGLMVGTGSTTSRIWYSFDEGKSLYNAQIAADHFIDLISRESSNNHVVAGINYNKLQKIYSIFVFNFSNIISSLFLIKDRTCQTDDYETWYVSRTFGTCFQGQMISYLRKKPFAMCSDDRKIVLPSIKSCPCSLADFPWYDKINHSKPNYISENNVCVWDSLSNFTKPVKTCRDGGRPLNSLNGYVRVNH